MHDIRTNNPDLVLTAPDPERDAPYAYNWFISKFGKETLLLMGNAENEIKPSTLGSETETLQSFIELEQENKQLTWMIRDKNKTIGAVWVELVDTPEVKSPAVHIMIGDKDYRGKGIGKTVIGNVIDYVDKDLNLHDIYSRHLATNESAKALLSSFGFLNDGDIYTDSNELTWQNVHLHIGESSQ